MAEGAPPETAYKTLWSLGNCERTFRRSLIRSTFLAAADPSEGILILTFKSNLAVTDDAKLTYEQLSLNQRVTGSSPVTPTTNILKTPSN